MENLKVPKHLFGLYHSEKKRFHNAGTAYQRSGFFKLPLELQIRIAEFIGSGHGKSQINRFLSIDLYIMRLVCKGFGSIGATVMSSHAKANKHSAYKSILCDFTDRSLRLISSVSKNEVLKRTVTSVYFVLWRFDQGRIEAYIRTANENKRKNNLTEIEMIDRWQQRQDFFEGSSAMVELGALLSKSNFPELSNFKWIENNLHEGFYSRRPQRYASVRRSTVQLQGSADTFTRMLSIYTALRQQIDGLVNIFQNLTHLHLLATHGAVSWNITTNAAVWADLVGAMINLHCLRIEGHVNDKHLKTILKHGQCPRLCKLVLGQRVRAESLLPFLQRHSTSLQDIRFEDVTVVGITYADLLIGMRRCVSHAKVRFRCYQGLVAAAIADTDLNQFLSHRTDHGYTADYGSCVMKKTLPSTPFDDYKDSQAAEQTLPHSEEESAGSPNGLNEDEDEESPDDHSDFDEEEDIDLEMQELDEEDEDDEEA